MSYQELIEMDVVGRPIEAFEMVVPFQLVSGTCCLVSCRCPSLKVVR